MLEKHDLEAFSITSWYNCFENVALKSIILPIPAELLDAFREGLSEDEIIKCLPTEFLPSLKNAINSCGGRAFIKSNWHAPIDAKFMVFGNEIAVSNVRDFVTCFTYSQKISTDLEQSTFYSFCVALKPFMNIHPAAEFRCIVINDILYGITPRDWPTFYAHYSEDGSNIIHVLGAFFQENIKTKFPRKTYTFDLVLEDRNKVILLDFGPLNSKANLYAFSWKEIQAVIARSSNNEVPPVFRYLESDMGIMTRSEAVFKVQQSQQ